MYKHYVMEFQAVGLVVKTRWERYRLHMMPLYQFDPDLVSFSFLNHGLNKHAAGKVPRN